MAIDTLEFHRSIAAQLEEPSRRLDELLAEPGVATRFQERAHQLQRLIDDSRESHRRLSLARKHWDEFRQLASRVDDWLGGATLQLNALLAKSGRERLNQDDCLQYWVRLYFQSSVILFYTC